MTVLVTEVSGFECRPSAALAGGVVIEVASIEVASIRVDQIAMLGAQLMGHHRVVNRGRGLPERKHRDHGERQRPPQEG